MQAVMLSAHPAEPENPAGRQSRARQTTGAQSAIVYFYIAMCTPVPACASADYGILALA